MVVFSASMPDFSIERERPGVVAGIDEAGRGPWAGPVVAAAVVLDSDGLPAALARGLDDSKRLNAARRHELFGGLRRHAVIGVGAASVAEIEERNILQATFKAMARAVEALPVAPALALVDGNRTPALVCRAEPVIGGDGRSLSIAAASIVAKITRDRIMIRLAARYPGFGWERNAGYGTPEHKDGLDRQGVTPHHRRTFAPIRKILRSPRG